MKRSKIAFALLGAALVCASGVAHAARVGVYIGGGGYYPWGWGPVPYYYPYPPPVAVPVPVPVPAQPQEYIEQGQSAPAPAAQSPGGTWYYCDDSRSYYPYVKSCASGWRPVPAQQSSAPAN